MSLYVFHCRILSSFYPPLDVCIPVFFPYYPTTTAVAVAASAAAAAAAATRAKLLPYNTKTFI